MATDYLIDGSITMKVINHLIENAGKNNGSGAHSIFLGRVRADEVRGKKVKAILYTAYDSMVTTEADKIKESVLSEYKDAKSVDIVHSTGLVPAGDISLMVLVTAGHRHDAIEACSKTVELIKEKFPIWKKEIFEDDSSQWK